MGHSYFDSSFEHQRTCTKMMSCDVAHGAHLRGDPGRGRLGLQWLQFHLLVRTHPLEIYLAIFAVAFMALGAWLALRLRRRPAPEPFEFNRQAQDSLGLSEREFEVLGADRGRPIQQGNRPAAGGVAQHGQDHMSLTCSKSWRASAAPRPSSGPGSWD